MSIEFRLVCYTTLDKFIRGGFAQPGDTDGQTKVRTRSQRTITHLLPRELLAYCLEFLPLQELQPYTKDAYDYVPAATA